LSDDLTDLLRAAYATYPGKSVKPGVICVAAIPYVMDKCYVVRPYSPNPQSPEHRRYKLLDKTPAGLALAGQDKWTLPFKDLNLDSNEDILVVKVKRRPVVVLSRAIADERKADPERIQDSFWCVPSYTLLDQFFHPQVNTTFIEDVEALTYRSFFPMPYDPHLHDRVAMLRLDRMQPIPRHCLNPIKRRITDEWLLYLTEWARFHITGRLGDEDSDSNPNSVASALKTAREALMEELANKRAKQEAD